MSEVITICPECEEWSLVVKILDCGTTYPPEDQEIHWFHGEGKCSKCGWKGFYGDST